MTISPAIIESIQRAGAAVFLAHSEVQAASLEQGQQVGLAITSNPFGLENNGLIESWKALARLAQELKVLDGQLRAIHDSASGLVSNNAIVVTELPRLSNARSGKASKAVKPAEVIKVVKAAKLAKAPAAPRQVQAPNEPKASKAPAQDTKAPKAPKAPKAAKAPKGPRPIRGNDAKVQTFLSQVLVREEFKPVRQVEIAEGAAIPLGSVARSVGQLIARGLLLEGSKGSYRLA